MGVARGGAVRGGGGEFPLDNASGEVVALPVAISQLVHRYPDIAGRLRMTFDMVERMYETGESLDHVEERVNFFDGNI